MDLLIMLHEKYEILFIVFFLFASSLILPHEVFSLLLIKFGLFFISFCMLFKISGSLDGFFFIYLLKIPRFMKKSKSRFQAYGLDSILRTHGFVWGKCLCGLLKGNDIYSLKKLKRFYIFYNCDIFYIKLLIKIIHYNWNIVLIP